MKILHIVPSEVVDPKQRYLGSTKDIRGRTEYFQARNIAFDELVLAKRDDRLLVKKLEAMDLTQYQAAIVELILYPRSLKFLQQHSSLKVIARSINAELYHRFHHLVAKWQESNEGLKSYAKLLAYIPLRFRWDYLSAKWSDYLLSISDWETRQYWTYFAGRGKIVTMPYFLPKIYLDDIPVVSTEKKPQCVCLMSTIETAFVVNAAHNFLRLATQLGEQLPEWKFFITGDRQTFNQDLPARVQSTGLLTSPLPLLQESKAMALLSDYGFGFKTKIMDAIACGCYILVTKKLYQRLPPEVQPYSIVVDLSSINSFREALERCQQPFPTGNPNEALRDRAFAALDKILSD